MTDLERDPADASELEGGGTEQTWGQGEGQHEPTLPDDDQGSDDDNASADESPPSVIYVGGTPAAADDPDQPLSRDDEGMDR
jgi:hypothetical protein